MSTPYEVRNETLADATILPVIRATIFRGFFILNLAAGREQLDQLQHRALLSV